MRNEAQIAASRSVLERSQAEERPYDIDVCGLSFTVDRGVFSPKYFDSTRIFSTKVPCPSGGSFLEIGCGTGVTSVIVALSGARSVLAVDINAAAVANTLKNARRHGVEGIVTARQSNIFDGIAPEERFDTIYWNLPFIYIQPEYEFNSVLERALFDPDYRYTRRFLAQAREHLVPGGRLVAGFADFGDMALFHRLADEYRWSVEEIARSAGAEGGPVTFILYQLLPQ